MHNAFEPCGSRDSCLPDVIDFKWKDGAQLSWKRALVSVDVEASRTYHRQSLKMDEGTRVEFTPG